MAQARLKDTKETSRSHFDCLHYVYCLYFLKIDRKLPFLFLES